MAYFTQEQLAALIPEGWLTDGLDDDANGSAEAFEQVRRMAEARVNRLLGMRYTVPFEDPSPALAETLLDAAAHIAAHIVYGRRQQQDKFPYRDTLAELIETLKQIGAGTHPLSPAIEQANDHAAIISEPSRVYSENTGF